MPKLTLITHVFNEQFLMPYFISHHLPLVDHGVVVNHACSDKTMDIVREMAPSWDIITSELDTFDARRNDQEIMGVERLYPGWKIVLNATEFLFHPNPKDYIEKFEKEHPSLNTFSIWSIVMVDSESERYHQITANPLFFQRFNGYLDKDRTTRTARVMHKAEHGNYHVGRHGTHWSTINTDDIYILWFGWSPYEYIKERKLQIQTRIPASDKALRLGIEHIQTPESLEQEYIRQTKFCYDMRNDPVYRSILEEFYRKYGFR